MTPAPASSPPAISAVIIRGRRIARSALSPSKLVQRQPSHVGPSDNVTAKLPRVIKHNNRKPVFENSRRVVARDAGWDGREIGRASCRERGGGVGGDGAVKK